MKISTLVKRSLVLILGVTISLNWYFAYASSSAGPTGYTNAPKDCGNCTSCHSGTLKSKSARIKLSGLAGGYTAKDTFHMTLTYLNSSSAKGHAYGFELVVLDSAKKTNLGTIRVTDKTNTSLSSSSSCSGASRSYLTHTSSGIKAAASKTWKFDWIAPTTTTNTVIFYAIINSANNDGSDGGDTIFAQEFHFRVKPTPATLTAGFKCASSVCTGDSLAITDTTKGTPSSWSWTFQNGSPSTSTRQNPKVAFASSGSDSITLTVKDGSGNTSYKKFTVTVNAPPTATITPSSTSAICPGDSIMFTASSGSSYIWSNGATSQSIYVKDSTPYTVKVTNSSGCSAVSTASKIQLKAPPVATITPSTKAAICQGDSVQLTSSSASSYLWSNGATSQSIYVKDTLPYTVKVTGASGCSATSSVSKIKINPVANVKLSLNKGGKYCFGDTAILTAIPSGLGSYVFSKNKSIIASTGNVAKFAASTILSSDVFSVKATNNGCSATSRDTTLSYTAPLNPGFTYSDTQGIVSFSDTTTGNSSRLWNFGDGSSTSTSKSPIHAYTKKGIYTVLLTVYNSNGCADSISMPLNIVITGIQQVTTLNEVHIYPNPFSERITLSVNSTEEQKMEINLLDMQGRLLLSRKEVLTSGTNSLTLLASDINAGTYILQLKGQNEIKYFNLIKTN